MDYLYGFCTENRRAPATEYQNLTSINAELVNGIELSCGL
jgi:undecaprenyl pyrophosphate synthase